MLVDSKVKKLIEPPSSTDFKFPELMIYSGIRMIQIPQLLARYMGKRKRQLDTSSSTASLQRKS